ncbi:MAG: GatB/YqeY domain-containing protein [Chloroflexi bacterium]|nr:MAG: GatB/YqeY domain-containing protein [Chloroflexota bacterium]
MFRTIRISDFKHSVSGQKLIPFQKETSVIIGNMDTKTKLNQDMKEAMRARDKVTKRTLTMVRAAIQQTEKDRREELDESAVLAILQKEVKSRHETITEAKKAGRDDLVVDTEEEIVVLKKYLPEEMSAEDLHALAAEVIAEVNASTIRDMGNVMKALIPRVAGRASGGDISKVVRELLQN